MNIEQDILKNVTVFLQTKSLVDMVHNIIVGLYFINPNIKCNQPEY
jgi:hypothetical protein